MPNEDGIVFLSSLNWAKDCAKGDGKIAEGEQSFWDKRSKPYKYYHVACYKKQENIKALAKGAGQEKNLLEKGSPKEPYALDEAEEDKVVYSEASKDLKAAVRILCRRFNLEEGSVNPDSIVLSELVKTLNGIRYRRWADRTNRR